MPWCADAAIGTDLFAAVSRFHKTDTCCDGLARGRDDYEQDLWLVVNRAVSLRRLTKKPDLEAERQYARVAAWNALREAHRTITRRAAYQPQPASDFMDSIHDGTDPFARVAARESLTRIFDRLNPYDASVLLRLGFSGGVIAQAYDPKIDRSLASFQRHVVELRKRAKIILDSNQKLD